MEIDLPYLNFIYFTLACLLILTFPLPPHPDTECYYITLSVTRRELASPLRQKSVSRTNYTKLCNNWPRNLGRESLLAAPSMSAKKKLSDPWLMAVMQMTSRFMRTDQLFYVQGSGLEIVLSTECWSLNGPAQMRSLMPVEYLCRNNVRTQSQTWASWR